MKRVAAVLVMVAIALGGAEPIRAQQQKADSGVRLGLAGNLYIAPEIWPDIGAKDDQKVGVGFGAMLGVALQIDNTRLGIGPHFGYNLWTADYSHKPNTATKSVSFGMQDAGLEMGLTMDNMIVMLGTGTSTMDALMTLDNGSDYRYPGLDKEKFGYNTVGVGFVNGRFVLSLVYTSYRGGAKDASHMGFRLGFGR
ncbi:MAG TPA: hypothetical protein VF483_04320 [Gemmatimonadaceae bacterium]